ncbi:MAG: outer membrane lipoprotein-sorting protein [Spirochaetales bacterium]|nr:outer membrane lipoprotein-sorting protein [Spirochaetales bacterium]
MGRKLLYGLMGLALLLPLSAQTGREIMEKVMDNQKPASSAMDIRMNLIDSRGNISTRRIQTLTMEENGMVKTITLFLEPATVRNTRFLTVQNDGRDDDQWIYLPSLRKIKRIASGERDGSFMGSDFTYADMGGNDLDHSDFTILRDEIFSGRSCWVIQSVSAQGKESNYGKTISWVDKETYLTLKVEFYDDDGTTQIKELTMEGLRETDGFWSAARTTMKTLSSNHQTILEMRQVKYNIPINPGYFTTNFLQTGRP